MKQQELRKFLGKQGAKISPSMKVLSPYYVFHDETPHIIGTSTNEHKSDLVKSGYDIICPSCNRHWGEGTHRFTTRCIVCGYAWRTDMRGIPQR